MQETPVSSVARMERLSEALDAQELKAVCDFAASLRQTMKAAVARKIAEGLKPTTSELLARTHAQVMLEIAGEIAAGAFDGFRRSLN